MTKKQEFLKNACDQCGLDIQLNVEVATLSGSNATADAVISQSNGLRMFIFEITPDRTVLQKLREQGDGCSSFGEPLANEKFDLDSYVEMFREWGFSI